MTAQRTAGPWKLAGRFAPTYVVDAEGNVIADCDAIATAAINGPNQIANAAFIVEACNSYDAVLAKVDKFSKAVCRRAENEEKALKEVKDLERRIKENQEELTRLYSIRDDLRADVAKLRAALETIRNGMADDRAYRDCARTALANVRKVLDNATQPTRGMK